MHKYIIAMLCLLFYVNGFSQIVAPAMSPLTNYTQKIGLTTIEIQYFRPSARGRKIVGNDGILQKDETWRTGANSATKISIDKDLTISGQYLSKGTYALLSVPNEREWELLFYVYDSGNWQSYLKKVPVLELKSTVEVRKDWQESLLLSIENLKLGSADLVMAWGNVQVKYPVETDLEAQMSQVIDREMAGPSMNDYFQAALYLHEAGIDLEKALDYVQKVTTSENVRFFHVYREALILKDLKRNEEAKVAAKRSKKLSAEAGNDDLVRLSERILRELN